MKIRTCCSECGAALLVPPSRMKSFKTHFCNLICKGLNARKHKNERVARLVRWKRRQARIWKSPELLAAYRLKMRAHATRRKADPIRHRRSVRMACLWQKRRYITDPVYRAKKIAYARAYEKRKREASV